MDNLAILVEAPIFNLQLLVDGELFGANVRSVDAGLGTLLLADGRISVPYVKLVAFAACAVLGVVLMRLLKSTRFGQAVRATAQNARAARILGVDTDHVYAATFA